MLKSGATNLEHVAVALSMFVGDVVLVGCHRPPLALPLQVHCLPDHQPGLGPLGGIVTLLRSRVAPWYLVAACNQPLLHGGVLGALVGAPRQTDRVSILAAAAETDHFAPLPSLWPDTLAPALEDFLAHGGRSFREFFEAHPPMLFEASEQDLARARSFNTMDELLEAGLVEASDANLAASATDELA
jgi:molybdopterin-guanine dinucleotide biosynthesis protein A